MNKPSHTNQSDVQRAPRSMDQMVARAHAPAQPTASHRVSTKRTFKNWKKIALIAVVVLLVGGMGYSMWRMYGGGNGIETNRYQAVFLTNGQVYFGKLSRMNNEYYKLTDIYYMQSTNSTSDTESTSPQQTTQTGGNVQIIKLGDEIHGPEDKMIIGRDQVLFYENLKTKDGSKVVSAIADYQAQKK